MIFLNLWIISYKVLAMLTQFYAGYIFTTMVISCVDLKSDLNVISANKHHIFMSWSEFFKSDFHWRMKVSWQHGQKQYHLFLLHKRWGGFIFPSTAVVKIIKMSEIIFKRRVIENEKGITSERNLDLKIQSGILAQIGTDIFNNIGGHCGDHTTGEGDHLTSLLRLIVAKYVSIRLKS